MSEQPNTQLNCSNLSGNDEGGLHAPTHLRGWRKWWWWFDFIILVKLARLRFVGILVLIGLAISQWDLLLAYYDRWTRPATSSNAQASNVEWFCPMHPSVVRDNAKDKCPICFMPLSKRTKGNRAVDALPDGVVSRVQLSPYRIVLAGVQTTTVGYVPLEKEISAAGYIEFNESLQRGISARFGGRIDKLFANQTGQMVKEGDPLASVYSPELVVAIKSLQDAKSTGNKSLMASTQARLELLGINDMQIDELLRTSENNTQVTIRSPINGHVIRKYIREGQYIQEGMPLFDVADLNTVWIQAQVYEEDLLFLPDNLAYANHLESDASLLVTATTKSLPNEEFHGVLSFVYPHVDQQTRTVTVRFALDNPHHKLRPGSAASVTLKVRPEQWALVAGIHMSAGESLEHLKQGELLAVPQSSIIDTGTQKIVYRETEPNVFEGVLVQLGPKMHGPNGVPYFPVLDGLDLGASIVSSGSFLVDAETRLNPSAGSIYFGGSGGSAITKSSVSNVRPSTPDDPQAKLKVVLAKMSPEDQQRVKQQGFCAILTQNRLGSMGTPIKLNIEGKTLFLCCNGCSEEATTNPTATLATLDRLLGKTSGNSSVQRKADTTSKKESDEISAAIAELPSDEQVIAKGQQFCALLPENALGSMGRPIKLMIDGKPVFVCCDGCREAALKDPKTTLRMAQKLSGAKRD